MRSGGREVVTDYPGVYYSCLIQNPNLRPVAALQELRLAGTTCAKASVGRYNL